MDKPTKKVVIELLENVRAQRYSYGDGEDLIFEDEFDDATIQDLVMTRDELDNLSRDIRKLKSHIDDMLKGRLDNKAIRIGDRVFRGRNTTKLVPYDEAKVLDWLGDDWKAAVRPSFRVTGVKAIAEQRGSNPNVVVESLFERKELGQLDVNSIERSPKFLQELLDKDGKEVDIYPKKEDDNG